MIVMASINMPSIAINSNYRSNNLDLVIYHSWYVWFYTS